MDVGARYRAAVRSLWRPRLYKAVAAPRALREQNRREAADRPTFRMTLTRGFVPGEAASNSGGALTTGYALNCGTTATAFDGVVR